MELHRPRGAAATADSTKLSDLAAQDAGQDRCDTSQRVHLRTAMPPTRIFGISSTGSDDLREGGLRGSGSCYVDQLHVLTQTSGQLRPRVSATSAGGDTA